MKTQACSSRVGRSVILAAIVLLAAALRLAYFAEISKEPEFRFPQVDALYHEYWARGLATGDWTPPAGHPDPGIARAPFFKMPGYPYFLAAIYWLFGAGPAAPRIVQMCLGLLNCILAYFLGRRLFDCKVGLLFAGLMSTYWSFVYFEGDLLEPPLLITLGLVLILSLALWTEKLTVARVAGAGIVLGLFALVRSNVLFFGLLVIPWSWWVARRQGLRPEQWAGRLTVYACCAILTIAPATIRNWSVAGDFVLISTNDGVNLLLGNNDKADGRVAGELPGFGLFRGCFDYPALVRSLERRVGRPLSYPEASAGFRDEAFRFIREHPGRAFALAVRKTLLFWGPVEVGNNREDEVARAQSGVLRLLPGGFAFALSFCTLGVCMFAAGNARRTDGSPAAADEARRQFEAAGLVLLFIAAYFATHLPFVVAGRFRIPLVPYLLLFAAFGIVRVVEIARSGELRRALLWLFMAGMLYALVSRNPTGYRPDPAKWYYQRGAAYTSWRMVDKAAAAYREGLREAPRSPDLHVNLGALLKLQGRTEEAASHYAEAIRSKPDDAEAHLNLGVIFAERGQLERALAEYRTALQIQPEMPDGHFNIGVLLAARRDFAAAATALAEAVRLNPRDAEAHASLGEVWLALGNTPEAARNFRRALELRPGLEQARKGLARIETGTLRLPAPPSGR